MLGSALYVEGQDPKGGDGGPLPLALDVLDVLGRAVDLHLAEVVP